MSKTLTDLANDTRRYLDEAQPADFTVQDVLSEINYAYADVVTKVVEIYEDFYTTTTPIYISTVANTQEYSLDESLIKISRVEINYQQSDPNSQALRAIAIKREEIPLNIANEFIGGGGIFNSGYYVYGPQGTQKIGFVPVPQEAGTNNVSVWGIVAPSDLVSGTDVVHIPYPDRYAQLVGLRAASELLRKGQQEEVDADRYLKNYLLQIQDMQTFLKERQADGPVMVVDAEFSDVNFGDPLGSA